MELNRQTILAAAIALFLTVGFNVARADTYTVRNTGVSGPESLAQAILDSNAHTGQDTIVFQIPGSGVHLIDLSQTSLPEITDSVVVDGYTQPGTQPNTLSVGDNAVILIQLDGGLVKGRRGIVISGSNCLVRGLSITGFQYDPSSDPTFNQVVNGFGIQLRGGGSGNVIQGNFIGLKPDGLTPVANFVGVRVEAAQSIIGGSEPAARNVISGNTEMGIEIRFPSAVIVGNYVGTDLTGMRAVGNDWGIAAASSDVVVGGTSAGAGNLISGNSVGIQLGYVLSLGFHVIGHADRALIQGNLIGTGADGMTPLGNGETGVSAGFSSNSTMGELDAAAGNVIAFNGEGVLVSGTGNRVLSNSIYSNIGRGILLSNQNANNGQASPVLVSQSTSHGITTISGTLHSAPNTQFLLQFFSDSQSLTTSVQTYVGSKSVTTNDNGDTAFIADFPNSDPTLIFNATATDPNGNTSEFSRRPSNLQNLSARAAVGTGDNALIGGLQARYGSIVVRGIGPSLTPLGVTGELADPTLEFQDQSGTKMFNDNWRDDQNQANAIQQSGLAPTNDAESAIAPFVANSPFRFTSIFNPYTAVLRGKGDTTGIGVVEIYGFTDPNHGVFPKLGNISARGFVGTGDNVLIGGFILGDGNEPPRIVVRAIGPSLKASGIANALPDPVLELHDGNGLLIQRNDNWADSQNDDLQAVGLALGDAAESAILVRLPPVGSYSAIVRGKGAATGIALVEVYRLP